MVIDDGEEVEWVDSQEFYVVQTALEDVANIFLIATA